MLTPDLKFGVITDLHLGWDDDATRNVRAAIMDYHSLDLDLIVILGDMADMRDECWALVFEHLTSRIELPAIYVRGNADFQAGGEAAWQKNIDQPHRYAMSMKGVRMATTGAMSDAHVLVIGEEGPAFLADDMAEHEEELGVILCHAPVKDTTFWSCDNNRDSCLARLLPPEQPPFLLHLCESELMAEALRRSTNVRLILTGHVHNDHRMICDHGYGPWTEKDGVIHLATANLGGWRGFGVERREGRIIHITQDEISVRVRDVVNRCFVPELDLCFPTRRP